MTGSPSRRRTGAATRRWSWRGLPLLPLVLLAVLGAGCGDDDAPSDETGSRPGAPADGGEASGHAGPGTQIAEGLVVPPGTTMLGAPFASQSDGGGANPIEVRFQAVLQVTGDPVHAFADLLEQAAAAGIEMRTYVSGDEEPGACLLTDALDPLDEGEWVPLGAEAELSGGPVSVECEVSGLSEVAGNRQHQLEAHAFVSQEDEPYVSFIEVTYTQYRIEGPPETLFEEYVPLPPLDGDSPVQPPEPPDSLPQPGDALGDPYAPSGEDYELLDGSQLLAPPAPPECITGGFVAVVHADDQLDEALDRYDQEVRRAAFNSVDEPDTDLAFEHEGVEYRYRTYSAAGGGDMRLWATPAPEGGTYLLMDRCND